MTWPSYSPTCRRAVEVLLRKGGSLSAYKANPQVGVEPSKDSWAWRLEREIEKKFGFKHAVAVNSGTAGLHCALVGAGITSGEVVTSPFSFSATVSAILHAGCTPVFADVDPYTFNITPESVRKLVNKRTRALLPVSLFGGLAETKRFVQQYPEIPVIEDAAQAVGASSGGTFAGGHALAAMYSFNGGKQVPAGECGATVTNDSKVAHRARLLMNHWENFGNGIGYNYRPNELTACVAYHGLLELEERNQRRIDLAETLLESMGEGWTHFKCPTRPTAMSYNMPPWDLNGGHVFYVLPLNLYRGADRDKFIKRMKRMGIPVGAGYITPTLNHYPAFRKYARGPLPVVEELSSKTLCILSTLTPDRPLSYAKHVAECMRKALA